MGNEYASPEIPSQPHTLPEIDARLNDLQEQLKPLEVEIQGVFDDESINEGLRIAMASDADTRIEELGHPSSIYEDMEAAVQTLQAFGTEPMRVKIDDLLSIVRPALDEAIELETRAIDLSEHELSEATAKLAAQTNWTSVIHKASVEGGHYGDLSTLFAWLNDGPSNTKRAQDHKHNLSRIVDIESWRQRFYEEGDIFPEGEAAFVPVDWAPKATPLDERLKAWAQVTRRIFPYLSPARLTFVEKSFPGFAVANLETLSSNATRYFSYGPNRDTQRVAIPTPIAYAMELTAADIVNGFEDADEQYIVRQQSERPNTLFINGRDLLESTTDIKDTSGWVATRLARLPDYFTKGLGFLNFNDDSFSPKSGSAWRVAGVTSPPQNTIQVNLLKNDVPDFVKGDSVPEKYKVRNRYCIEGTLDHELMHFMHLHQIPIRWLRRWQSVVDEERVDVSGYVTQKRSDLANHTNPDYKSAGTEKTGGNASTEDLADSFSEFLNEPYSFYKKAPKRFWILNHLLPNRYPVEWIRQCEARESTNVNNYSELEIFARLNIGLVAAADQPPTVVKQD